MDLCPSCDNLHYTHILHMSVGGYKLPQPYRSESQRPFKPAKALKRFTSTYESKSGHIRDPTNANLLVTHQKPRRHRIDALLLAYRLGTFKLEMFKSEMNLLQQYVSCHVSLLFSSN